jgi:hypothetical protein
MPYRLIFHKLFLLRFLATEKMKDKVNSEQIRLWVNLSYQNKAFFLNESSVHFGLIQNEPKDQGCQRKTSSTFMTVNFGHAASVISLNSHFDLKELSLKASNKVRKRMSDFKFQMCS